jgi:DNA primase
MERRGIVLRPCGESTGSTARLEGCCPFHDDTTPSMSIYRESQQFHCFGCGAHGDVVDFVQRIRGISFADALRELEQEQRGQALPAPTSHRIIAATRHKRVTHPKGSTLPQKHGQHRDRSESGSLASTENHTPILSVALGIYQQVL